MSFFIVLKFFFFDTSGFWTSGVAITVTAIIETTSNTEAALTASTGARDDLDEVQDESEECRNKNKTVEHSQSDHDKYHLEEYLSIVHIVYW